MRTIIVNDKMQTNYTYTTVAGVGKLPSHFTPTVTPKQMLELGVFGGKYMTDCRDEFPASWFKSAKLSPDHYDKSINRFGVRASKSLKYWQDSGWIREEDPRGWFQWYCRFYLGRRIPEYDEWQITRWRNIRRHLTYILNRYEVDDLTGSPVRRQALLHWATLVDGTFTKEQLIRSFELT
ncbi:MAG: hypothetical protein JXR12_05915 [Neptunomonas phycophila]|uniref:hypothetical protein n=1 Tax=Neptunomonas phycophila TaxID=1572645 RepID=UPI003B8BAC45